MVEKIIHDGNRLLKDMLLLLGNPTHRVSYDDELQLNIKLPNNVIVICASNTSLKIIENPKILVLSMAVIPERWVRFDRFYSFIEFERDRRQTLHSDPQEGEDIL